MRILVAAVLMWVLPCAAWSAAEAEQEAVQLERYFDLPAKAGKGDAVAAAAMVDYAMGDAMAGLDVRSGPCAEWKENATTAAMDMTRRQVWGVLLANWACRHQELKIEVPVLMAEARAAIDADPVRRPALMVQLAWLYAEVAPQRPELVRLFRARAMHALAVAPSPSDPFAYLGHMRLLGQLATEPDAQAATLRDALAMAPTPLVRCLLARAYARWISLLDRPRSEGLVTVYSGAELEAAWQAAYKAADGATFSRLRAEAAIDAGDCAALHTMDPATPRIASWLAPVLDARQCAQAARDDAMARRAALVAVQLAFKYGHAPTDVGQRTLLLAAAKSVMTPEITPEPAAIAAHAVVGMAMMAAGDNDGVKLLTTAAKVADAAKLWYDEMLACRALGFALLALPPDRDVENDGALEAFEQATECVRPDEIDAPVLSALVCREYLDACWSRHQVANHGLIADQADAALRQLKREEARYELWSTIGSRFAQAGHAMAAQASWFTAAQIADAQCAPGRAPAAWLSRASSAWAHAGVPQEDIDGTPAPAETSRCRFPRYVDGIIHRMATATPSDFCESLETLAVVFRISSQEFWICTLEPEQRRQILQLGATAAHDLAAAAAAHHELMTPVWHIIHGFREKPERFLVDAFRGQQLNQHEGTLACELVRDAVVCDPDAARAWLRPALWTEWDDDHAYLLETARTLLTPPADRELLMWYLDETVAGRSSGAAAGQAITELGASGGCPRLVLDRLLAQHGGDPLGAAALSGIVARGDPDAVEVVINILDDPGASLVIVAQAVREVQERRISQAAKPLEKVLGTRDGSLDGEVLVAWQELGGEYPVGNPTLQQWASTPWGESDRFSYKPTPPDRYRNLAANLILDLRSHDALAHARILAHAGDPSRRYSQALINWTRLIDTPRSGELLAEVAEHDQRIGPRVAADAEWDATEQVRLYRGALANMHLAKDVRARIAAVLDSTLPKHLAP